MQNFQKQNELLEASYFQVEELEERMENCWNGYEKQTVTYQQGGYTVEKEILVPCGGTAQ
jgi:hypothetical protein